MSMGRLLLVALAAALIAGSIAMTLIIRKQAHARHTESKQMRVAISESYQISAP